MIIILAECVTRDRSNFLDGPRLKIRMAVDARSRSRSTECQFHQLVRRRADPTDRLLDLRRITTELLSEPHRRGIHQMGTATLQHIVELLGFGVERILKPPERRQQDRKST